jgi:hypothetical protein
LLPTQHNIFFQNAKRFVRAVDGNKKARLTAAPVFVREA